MALFRAKFSYILAISNPVFRWDSCKGSKWESMKKCSRLCKEAGTRDWILRVAHGCKLPDVEHVPSMPEVEASCQLEHYRTKSSNWSFSYLALELTTQSSRKSKLPASSILKNPTLRIPFSLQYKYPLYPRNIVSFQKEYWEKNPREKQDWLIHNLHIETLQIPLLSPSPLLHPWEVHYQNLFLTIPTSVKRPFGAWETVRRVPISYWLMLWVIAEFGKLKKK